MPSPTGCASTSTARGRHSRSRSSPRAARTSPIASSTRRGARSRSVARQLRRWKTQVDTARARDLPVIDEVHDELVATVPPEQGRPGLVHGDYRFDNTVLGPDRRVIAVLDWELATIGDPVADFAW